MNKKIICLVSVFCFCMSFTLVNAVPDNAQNVINFPVITNGSVLNVNNSEFWDGNAWSDTRWLEIDGSNANQDIDIGDYGFTAEDVIVDGELYVDDGITSSNNIEIWGSYFLKWLDNGGANTYAYIMASVTEFKIAAVSETDMNFYYGNLGSHLGASMDGVTGDWNFTEDINVDGDTYLSDTFPRSSLTYSLGSGALRWLNLFVQNINAEVIDAFNIDVSENLTVDGTTELNDVNIDGDLNVTGSIIRAEVPLMYGLATEEIDLIIINQWYNITFNSSISIIKGNLSFENNRTIIIQEDGDYLITFGVQYADSAASPSAHVATRIAKNGEQLGGSYVESETDKQNYQKWLDKSSYAYLEEGDTLEMQLISSDDTVSLSGLNTYNEGHGSIAYGWIERID